MVAEPVHHHPLLDCGERLESELAGVADISAAFLSPAQKAVALRTLARVEAEVAELRLRVLASADDLAESTAARDAGAWYAHDARVDPRAARADLGLAEALDAKYAKVAAGTGAST